MSIFIAGLALPAEPLDEEKIGVLVGSTIANGLAAPVKLYNLPAARVQLGLSAGDDEEALRSKAKYVERWLSGLPLSDLLWIAARVNGVHPSHDLNVFWNT